MYIARLVFSVHSIVLNQASPRNTTSPIALNVFNQHFQAGDLVKVELTAAQPLTLTGFQLALHFDERLLDFNGIGLNGSLTMDESNFGLNHISKGIVTSSWNNPYGEKIAKSETCLLYTSPSPRDATLSRMPSSA